MMHVAKDKGLVVNLDSLLSLCLTAFPPQRAHAIAAPSFFLYEKNKG